MPFRHFVIFFVFILFTACENEVEENYYDGLTLLEEEKYEGAIVKFSEVIQQDENYTSAYKYRGQAKFALGEYLDAIKDFNQTLKLDRELPNIQVDRCIAKTRLKNYRGALADLNNLIEYFETKQDTNTIQNVAIALNNRGLLKFNIYHDTISAFKDYSKAIEIDVKPSSFAHPYRNRAAIHVARNDYINALNDLDSAITINPNEHLSYYKRARVKFELNNFNGSISDCNQSISLNPNHWDSFNSRGLANTELGKYNDAINDFSKILKHRSHPYALNNRGYAKFRIGQYQDALIDCEQSLELDSTNSWVYYNLGLIKYELGEKSQACDFLKKADELGKPEAAKEILEKCQ